MMPPLRSVVAMSENISILRSLLVVVALHGAAVTEAQTQCDASLAPSTNHPYRYIDRGDRCEGVYVQAVSGSTLVLLSFTASVGEMALDSGQPLLLEWPAPPGGGDVQLRARSMQRHLFYRMDKRVPAGTTNYRWPSDGLAAVKLARADLGLLAFTRMPIAGVEQDVLLPLSAGQAGPGRAAAAAYTLLLRPAVSLSEVFVSVERLGPDGRAALGATPARELGYGLYPAEAPIEVRVAAPREPGLHRVLIGARLRSGGSATLQFIFHQGGP
ncbi:MAG: hypothetical protein WA210_12490 [Burkholderiaceae bacterium]